MLDDTFAGFPGFLFRCAGCMVVGIRQINQALSLHQGRREDEHPAMLLRVFAIDNTLARIAIPQELPMEKKKLTERLQLLNDGRAHYLDFLRNLTPQILLLSGAVLLGARLDFTRFDINNTFQTFIFFVVLGSFILAFWANASLFYERCSSDWETWFSELTASLTDQGITGRRRTIAKLSAIWRERFVEFVELQIIVQFFPFALAIVIAMAFNSAESIWRANHAG